MQRLSAVLLLLLGFPAQSTASQSPSEAETLFSTLGAKILAAKTLHVVCRAQFKTAGFEADVKATLLIKEGNRMRMESETKGFKDGVPIEYKILVISDGSRIRIRENQGEWAEYATTSKWNESVALNIHRGGFPTGLELMRIKKDGKSEDVGMAFRPIPPPTDYVLSPKDRVDGRDGTPIEFKVKGSPEFMREMDAVLWLDPAGGLPLKRMTIVRTERTLTVTETYEKFAIDETVEDASFVLPKGS